MFRKYTVVILLSLYSASTFSQTENKVLLEQGTVIKVKALESAKSNKIEEGDELEFEVYEQVLVKNKLLIKEGAYVKAYVESVQKARGLGKEGYLRVEFVNTTAVDGTKIPLRALRGSITGEEKSDNSIALAIFFSPAFLLKKGSQAKINEGKIMRVIVTKDLFINTTN
jgi:ribosomal protein L21